MHIYKTLRRILTIKEVIIKAAAIDSILFPGFKQMALIKSNRFNCSTVNVSYVIAHRTFNFYKLFPESFEL